MYLYVLINSSKLHSAQASDTLSIQPLKATKDKQNKHHAKIYICTIELYT